MTTGDASTPRVIVQGAVEGAKHVSLSNICHGRTFDCAFAPRERWESVRGAHFDEILVTCGEDGAGRVFGVRADDNDGIVTLERMGAARGHTEEVVRVSCARASGRFATGSADGTCALWSLEATGEVKAETRFEGHPGEVYGIAWLGEGTGADGLATCSETEVFRWDVERGTLVEKAGEREAMDSVSESAATPERWRPGYLFSMAHGGGMLACGCSDGVVRIYSDGKSNRFGALVVELPVHPNAIVGSTCFVGDGVGLISVGLDGTVVITDTRMWRTVRRVTSDSQLTSACEVGLGSEWFAMVGRSGIVRTLSAFGDSNPKCTLEAKDPVPLYCVASNERGTMLACAGAGVPSKTPALAAAFATKRPDPSRLDLFY
jgi:WD40 repeat protein